MRLTPDMRPTQGSRSIQTNMQTENSQSLGPNRQRQSTTTKSLGNREVRTAGNLSALQPHNAAKTVALRCITSEPLGPISKRCVHDEALDRHQRQQHVK